MTWPRVTMAALALFGLAVSIPADARSPARSQCLLSKSESTQAIELATEKFPEMGKPVVTGCQCVSDCSSLNVRMRPVDIRVEEHDISFNLRVLVSVPRGKDDQRIPRDATTPVDFSKAAAMVRKLPATKALFADSPLVCDAREQYGSFQLTCGTSDPRGQMSGGRPGHGAAVIGIHYDRGKWQRATFAGPLRAIEGAGDKRWTKVRRRDDVKAFLAKQSDVTVVFMFREINLHGPNRARLSVQTGPGW